MVEVSKLRSLEIYTNTGHYVGRVEDVVLNIRLGTISKLQVRAIEQQPKPAGVPKQPETEPQNETQVQFDAERL